MLQQEADGLCELWLRMLVGALIASVIPACAQGRLERQTLESAGKTREYYLQLPESTLGVRPLVLALHGGGGSATHFDRATHGQLEREAGRRGWIVCYPQGLQRRWNDGRDLEPDAPDDVAFLTAVVDELVAHRNADPQRVYALGISNGGFMSLRLAVECSERFAAVAAVTATLQRTFVERKPTNAVGVMVINGTADPLVPFTGGSVMVFGKPRGGPILSTAATIRWWVAHNGCAASSADDPLPDRDPDDGCRALQRRHARGHGAAEVTLIEVTGGGHTWPGGMQYLPQSWIGPVCRDFAAATEIFAFFDRHQRSALVDPAARR